MTISDLSVAMLATTELPFQPSMPGQPAPIILMLGPAGSGRGTQALALGKALGYHVIRSGRVLREGAAPPGIVHDACYKTMQHGFQVGDLLVNDLIGLELREHMNLRRSQGLIIKGYPGTAIQANHLAGLLSWFERPLIIIHMAIDLAVCRERLRARKGIGDLEYQITRRLDAYQRNIEPLRTFYRPANATNRGPLWIDCTNPGLPGAVTDDLLGHLLHLTIPAMPPL